MKNLINIIQNKSIKKYKFKNSLQSKIRAGDIISIIYYDVDKENVRVHQYSGLCLRVNRRNYNTKLEVKNYFGQTAVTKQFFLYSPYIVDIAVLVKADFKK